MNLFTGVVEDVNDPEQLGRLRVRIFGYHNKDTKELPTSDLPWSQVMMPVTATGLSGVGSSGGITNGVWVVGFFQDMADAQNPIILGALPGLSIKRQYNDTDGFRDPNNVFPSSTAEDIPREGRDNFYSTQAYAFKNQTRHEDVPIAVPCNVSTIDNSKADSWFEHNPWSQPDPAEKIKPVYPLNRVHHTVSGHVVEYDDTPGYERISEFHKSGTYREIYADGQSTTLVVGKRHTILLQGDNIYIEGDSNITITGNCRQLIKGNYHLEVDGDYTEKIRGSKQVKIGNNHQVEIGQSQAMNIQDNDTLLVTQSQKITVNGTKTETIAGLYDLTTFDQYTHLALGNYKLTSPQYSLFAPTAATLNSPTIVLDCKDANLGVNQDAITMTFSSTASADKDILTKGDVKCDTAGRIVSLNNHVHYDWFDGNNLTTNALGRENDDGTYSSSNPIH